MDHQLGPAIALLMTSVAWMTWAVDGRAIQQHAQRMGDLAKCERQLAVHLATLEAIVDNESAPPLLKRLAAEVSIALTDRVSVGKLAEWILTADQQQGAWSTEVGSLLADLRVTKPALATEFERCVDSGFVAGVLRWPETAASWRTLSGRFVSEPDRELLVATQVWRGSPDTEPLAAALV